MGRLKRWSWSSPRKRRHKMPLSRERTLIGSSFARRLRVEALEDRRLLAVTVDFTGGYEMQHWSKTGIAGGNTSISPASGATDEADFGYIVTLGSGGVSQRTADFTVASSPVTGSVRFDYQFTGNHAFFQANADFALLVGGNATPIVATAPTSGAFNFTGSATIVARQGQSFGFRIGGKNFDSFSQIVGTLTITNFVAYDSIVVDSTANTVDGNYSPGNLTLREAIGLANTIPGADTITFADGMSGQTILLGGTELEITETLTIDATALAENVTIDAHQQSRVMNFGATSGDLTLSGLTMRNGKTTSDGDSGGGIRFISDGTLAIAESTLSGNSTTGDNAAGGGIYSEHGAVALASSTLTGNSTVGNGAAGGGIFSGSGAVKLINSTLSGNSTAGHQAEGGGIATVFENVKLNQSTLSGNSTAGTDADGGGLYTHSGNVTLNQSTLSGNRTAGASANGGGIFTNFGVVTFRNSIIAGNTVAAGSIGPDLALDPLNTVTVNYSVIGTGITPAAGGNNISTNVPKLGPLANNGGPTKTHALLPGSPALDAGDPNGGANHNYELNNSLADALGGPSLVQGGGFLAATGYHFGPNQGLNLSSALAADEYSIEVVFSWDALGGYQKIIDFHNLADDTGLYSTGANLHFFDAAFVENVFSAGVPIHLVVTRDAATDVVAVYSDGVEVMNFVDVNERAVFNGLSQVIRFFQDDVTTGQTEAASGFVDRIRIFSRDLSEAEVAELVLDQRGTPFHRVHDGDGIGGARMDIGAFESQPNPLPGDYNYNGTVDAADYTVWRDTLGSTSDLRADGNGNGTVQMGDYDFWKSHFGQTLSPGAGGGAGALTLNKRVLKGGEAVAPVTDESIAAPVDANVNAETGPDWSVIATRPAMRDSARPPRERTNSFRVVESVGDPLLLLLASDRVGHSSPQDVSMIHDPGNDDHRADELDVRKPVNDPLALALSEWP